MVPRPGRSPPRPAGVRACRALYPRLEAAGFAPATVLQIRRIVSRALKVAVQRSHIARNVALPSCNEGYRDPGPAAGIPGQRVRRQGLEPRTRRLRVCCSAN